MKGLSIPRRPLGPQGALRVGRGVKRSDSASVSTTVWKPRVVVKAERTGERLPSRDASGSDSGMNLGGGGQTLPKRAEQIADDDHRKSKMTRVLASGHQ